MPVPRRLRRAVLPTALLALAALGVAPAATAAPGKPKPCPADTGASIVGTKRNCVPLARVLPLAGANPSRTAALAQRLVQPAVDPVLRRPPFLPARVRNARVDRRWEPVADRRGIALGARLDALVASARAGRRGPRAVTVTEPPPGVTVGPRSYDATARTTETDTASGITGTLELGIHGDLDDQGNPVARSEAMTIAATIGRAGAGTVGFSISARLNGRLALKDPCPTADGTVESAGRDRTTSTTSQVGTAFGIDFIRQSVRSQGDQEFVGTVADDATLRRATYSVRLRTQVEYSASFLGGLLVQNWSVVMNVLADGTLDGRTGRVTSGQTRITFIVEDRSGNGAAAARAALEGDRELRRRLEREAADAVAAGYDQIKGVEPRWQTPNACATITAPPPAPVAPGATGHGTATVRAVNGGGQPPARWEAAPLTRGSVGAGLPATGGQVAFDVVGDAPDPEAATVRLKLRATSRAGIAETDWIARAPEYDVVFTAQAATSQTPTFELVASSTASVAVRRREGVAQYALGGSGPMAFAGLHANRFDPMSCPQFSYGEPSGTLHLSAAFEPGANGPVVAFTVLPADQIAIHEVDCFGTNPFDVTSQIFLLGAGVIPVVRVPTAGGVATHSWDERPFGGTDNGSFALTVTVRP